MKSKIICIANRKGGVHKTTVTQHLGIALSESGARVLLVDLDYTQASLTKSVFGSLQERGMGVMRLFMDHDGVRTEDCIVKTKYKNLDILGSEETVSGKKISVEAFIQSEVAKNSILKNKLAEIEGRYDFVLIDTPPSLGDMTVNAMVSAQFCIIPTTADDMSTEGIVNLFDEMTLIRKQVNPILRPLGVLLVGVNGREKITEETREKLKDGLGDIVFKTEIKTNVKFKSLQRNQSSIFEVAQKPNEKGALEYFNLAKEVVQKTIQIENTFNTGSIQEASL